MSSRDDIEDIYANNQPVSVFKEMEHVEHALNCNLLYAPENRANTVLGIVTPHDFWHPLEGHLYAAIQDAARRNQRTPVGVLEVLMSSGWSSDVQKHARFLGAVAGGDLEDVVVCARVLLELSWRRAVREYAVSIGDAALFMSSDELSQCLTLTGRISDKRARLAQLDSALGRRLAA